MLKGTGFDNKMKQTKTTANTRCFSYCLIAMANIPHGNRWEGLCGSAHGCSSPCAWLVCYGCGSIRWTKAVWTFLQARNQEKASNTGSQLTLFFSPSYTVWVLPAFRACPSLSIISPWSYPYRYSPRCVCLPTIRSDSKSSQIDWRWITSPGKTIHWAESETSEATCNFRSQENAYWRRSR